MEDFKVGDFVRVNRGKTEEICRVTDDCLIENHVALSNGMNAHSEDCILWVPIESEWCWFWDSSDTVPALGQFYRMNKDRYESSAFDGSICAFCEPFIGGLPTRVKS